jgi:hypothetical protein
LPLIKWITVRLDVSETNGAVATRVWNHREEETFLRYTRRNEISDSAGERLLSNSRVHVQTVGLNAETKTCRHRAEGEIFLLTFPFIGHLRQSSTDNSGLLKLRVLGVVRKNCVRERIRVNATLLHCDLLTGRGREGKLANTTIDGEYNLSGQELPLSIMRLYLPPHGQIRQCCSETQNRDYLL